MSARRRLVTVAAAIAATAAAITGFGFHWLFHPQLERYVRDLRSDAPLGHPVATQSLFRLPPQSR